MGKIITAYRVTCTKAYMMEEQGSGYSLEPWGANTERYEGHSTPVKVELVDGVRVSKNTIDEKMLYKAGEEPPHGVYLDEAFELGWAKIVGE